MKTYQRVIALILALTAIAGFTWIICDNKASVKTCSRKNNGLVTIAFGSMAIQHYYYKNKQYPFVYTNLDVLSEYGLSHKDYDRLKMYYDPDITKVVDSNAIVLICTKEFRVHNRMCRYAALASGDIVVVDYNDAKVGHICTNPIERVKLK